MADSVDGDTLWGGTRSERMKDTRLVERALAESWPIPDSLRPRLIKYLTKIVEDVLLNPESNTLISRTSGRPITFGWTFTNRHIAVIWETVCDDPKMIRVRTAYEVKPKGRKA
jgi:hypothetical protein